MDLLYKLNTRSALCFINSIGNISLQQITMNTCKIPDCTKRVIIFANHIGKDLKLLPVVAKLIANDIGVVYVCDKLPQNKIISSKLTYLLTSWGDFNYNIFPKSNLFNYVGFYGMGFEAAKRFSKTYSVPLFKDINDVKCIAPKKQANTILFKMPSGELGDKLVALSLLSHLKRLYPNYKLDVYLSSERYNSSGGYCALFRDITSKCSTNASDFNENNYEKVFEISAYGLHGVEINEEVTKNYMSQSRFQRWSTTLNLPTPLRQLHFDYSVRESDGKRVERLYHLNKVSKPLVGIFPFSSNKTKDWDLSIGSSKWQQVINYLNDKNLTVIALHYKSLNFKNCINIHSITPIELGYIISKLRLGIGVEAGITHFCGLLGIPMMVFVSSSSPLVLRHYNNVRILRKGFCHSCNRFITPSLNSNCGTLDTNPISNCINSVTINDVYTEIEEFIKCLKIL